MTGLALPSLDRYDEWAANVADFAGATLHGSGVWNLPEGRRHDTSREACEALVALLARHADPDLPVEEGRVRSDYYWITDDDDAMVGFIAVRHSLNEELLTGGGHIGYSVRPSRRREGHARRALGLGLDRLGELGVDRALVACDDDNAGSAAIIEANGGVLEDVRDGARRYWIVIPDRSA